MDKTHWHKCRFPILAKRDVLLGGLIGDPPRCGNQVYRRKRNGKWEYSQDEDTCDLHLEAELT